MVVIALVAMDLWLKAWATTHLLGQPNRDLIPGVLGLTYLRNTGAAFGMFAGQDWGRWALAIVKVVLMGGLLLFYNRLPFEKRFWFIRIPIILIFAGGIGNLYDRIFLGAVRDMLMFLFVNFPVFNLADIFVTVGCFSAVFMLLFVVKDNSLL